MRQPRELEHVVLLCLRWGVVTVCSYGLYFVCMLLTGWGHGPYTFSEAVGSWFSVLLLITFYFDESVWGGVLRGILDRNVLLGNLVMLFLPAGFLVYYACTKRFVGRLSGGSAGSLLLAVHLAGSTMAVALDVIPKWRGGVLQLDLVLGAAGILAAGAFVGAELCFPTVERSRKGK
jgi:hypothetical protein